MNKITRHDAHHLAVRYHAYLTATDATSVRVWGRMLAETQRATGVELIPAENIERRIAAYSMAVLP